MKTKFKHILVPYVPSNPSKAALVNAKDIAQRHGSKLTILNVNPDKSPKGQVREDIKSIMDNCQIDYQLIEKAGTPYKEILALEKTIPADLILMGTHGSKERDPSWIGGNAYKVLSGSSCPVITFTGKDLKIGFKNIILPIADASETRQKVPLTVTIAKAYNATVHIAIVNKQKDQSVLNTLKIYAAQAEGFCLENGVAFTYCEIYEKNIANACIDYAIEKNADLIAIMSEREANTGFFIGHYAQKIINSTDCSVLTIHIKDTSVVGGSGY